MTDPTRGPDRAARPRLTDTNRADVEQFAAANQITFNAAVNLLVRRALDCEQTRKVA